MKNETLKLGDQERFNNQRNIKVSHKKLPWNCTGLYRDQSKQTSFRLESCFVTEKKSERKKASTESPGELAERKKTTTRGGKRRRRRRRRKRKKSRWKESHRSMADLWPVAAAAAAAAARIGPHYFFRLPAVRRQRRQRRPPAATEIIDAASSPARWPRRRCVCRRAAVGTATAAQVQGRSPFRFYRRTADQPTAPNYRCFITRTRTHSSTLPNTSCISIESIFASIRKNSPTARLYWCFTVPTHCKNHSGIFFSFEHHIHIFLKIFSGTHRKIIIYVETKTTSYIFVTFSPLR